MTRPALVRAISLAALLALLVVFLAPWMLAACEPSITSAPARCLVSAARSTCTTPVVLPPTACAPSSALSLAALSLLTASLLLVVDPFPRKGDGTGRRGGVIGNLSTRVVRVGVLGGIAVSGLFATALFGGWVLEAIPAWPAVLALESAAVAQTLAVVGLVRWPGRSRSGLRSVGLPVGRRRTG